MFCCKAIQRQPQNTGEQIVPPRRRPGLPPPSPQCGHVPLACNSPRACWINSMRHQVNRNTYVHQLILLNMTLDAIPPSRHSRSSLHKPKVGRKEARKQNREGKKRRKAEYFMSTGTNSKRLASSPHPDSPPPKKRTVAGHPSPQSSGRQSEKSLSENSSRLTSKKTKAVTSSRTPSSRSVTHPTLPRSQQEEDEDRYIALLEKKLTSGKRSKNEPGYLKDIMNDGLGGV